MLSRNNTQTFLENFKGGDLVFGLAGPRARVVDKLKALGYTYVFANQLNNKLVTLVVKDLEPGNLHPRKQEHFEFLQRHKDFLTKLNGKPIVAMRKSESISIAYRRACKAILKNHDDDRTYTVHFLLKDIDWQRVCRKQYSDELTDDSVTASELRALYRDCQVNGLHPQVIFYDENLIPCTQAPWEIEEYQYLWREYDKARVLKQNAAAERNELEEASTQELDMDLSESADADINWICTESLSNLLDTNPDKTIPSPQP